MSSKIAIALLLMLGITMLVLGIVRSILPPALTGVGFIIIAYLFFDRQRLK